MKASTLNSYGAYNTIMSTWVGLVGTTGYGRVKTGIEGERTQRSMASETGTPNQTKLVKVLDTEY